MTLNLKDDYMSSPQAAKVLRITSVGVAQLARQGKIPAVKIANRWLVPRAFLKDFARTYEGKRGRPRKCRRLVPTSPTIQAAPQPAMADPAATLDVSLPRRETSGILTVDAWVSDLEEMPVAPATPETEASPVEAAVAGALRAAVDAAPPIDAGTDQGQGIPDAAPRPDQPPPEIAAPVFEQAGPAESAPPAAPDGDAPAGQTAEPVAATPPEAGTDMSGGGTTTEAADSGSAGDGTFSISAEVYHLDKNYDFEVYEKGQMTERARLVVARLKPKIPSLPQFSFRWDYRYEHLNVDIQGVEPNVVDWWTMGENGYTGHLPRRLAGPGYAFEAIIWLPVTFVFRGRLTLSLPGIRETDVESPSVATTTGGLRKLWSRWPSLPSR